MHKVNIKRLGVLLGLFSVVVFAFGCGSASNTTNTAVEKENISTSTPEDKTLKEVDQGDKYF